MPSPYQPQSRSTFPSIIDNPRSGATYRRLTRRAPPALSLHENPSRNGDVTLATFDKERLTDAVLLDLIDKTTIVEDAVVQAAIIGAGAIPFE